jgi:hypothetical protein
LTEQVNAELKEYFKGTEVKEAWLSVTGKVYLVGSFSVADLDIVRSKTAKAFKK